VRAVLIALEKAFTAKDAQKLGSLFSEDTIFIDQTGDETSGRAALQDRFAQVFQSDAASVIGLHPEKTSFLANNVALVVGVVSRRHDKEQLPESRFSMLIVKQKGDWLIKQITETLMQAEQTQTHLQELSWLIGDWQVSNPDASAHMNVEWAPGKKFINSKITLSKKGNDPQIDSQIIGWDPQSSNIVSWHFDSNGGFGVGTWTKRPGENQWTVDVAGVGADGSNTRASNVFTQKTADDFVWQSVHRSLDGIGVADSEALNVQRVKR
jgi:uncharacterized protein (TIGR02246 family)